jgi:hypothetical protein
MPSNLPIKAIKDLFVYFVNVILETTFRIIGKLLMNMGAPRQFHNVDTYTYRVIKY